MDSARPTPRYLRHRAQALRDMSQRLGEKEAEYCSKLMEVATRLDGQADEIERETPGRGWATTSNG